MFKIKPLKIKELIFLACFLPFSAISSADYFAYIPDQANDESSKYLHVVNTTYDVLVDSILLFGTPRDVVLSNGGDFVFVSTVVDDGLNSSSKINIIDTLTNINYSLRTINHNNVRGLTLSSDDSILFVTHEDGITRIKSPTFYSDPGVDLNLTYAGTSMAISDDDKYLFVIGTDGNNNHGISVVDVSQDQMVEITTYSIGTDVGVSAIVFDKLYGLYLVNTSNNPTDSRFGGSLINLTINNYDSPDTFEIVQGANNSKHDFPLDTFPVDLALNSDSTEVFVALSYINNETGIGSGKGYITVIDASNLGSEAIYNMTDLSAEGGGSGYENTGAIHPLSVAFDDSGQLHVVKQIWNEYAGTYVSQIDDFTSIRNQIRTMSESGSVHLGKRSSSQLTGKFVGAECTECPNGLEDNSDLIIHPSAIHPFMLLLSLIFLIPLRFKRTQNI